MRRLLEGIYSGAAVLAALCMVLLLLAVLLSIASRQLNFQAPGIDAYAGYLMAGAGFLALAHTLKRGEHIRVTLILNLLRGRWKRRMELWALGAASLLALLFAFYSCNLAVACLQRHLHRQRRHTFVASTDCHGAGHGGAGDCVCR